MVPESVDSQMSASEMPASESDQPDLGRWGEDLVAAWLRSQGWTILYQQWKCKSGELDVVAESPLGGIAFVEVKTRSRSNWDSDGLLAITPAKQAKLWKAAQLFLLKHPQYTDRPCRFDVAIVQSRAASRRSIPSQDRFSQTIAGTQLSLRHYLPDAFSEA